MAMADEESPSQKTKSPGKKKDPSSPSKKKSRQEKSSKGLPETPVLKTDNATEKETDEQVVERSSSSLRRRGKREKDSSDANHEPVDLFPEPEKKNKFCCFSC